METYPVASGFKATEASRIAAKAVDADPERKLNTQLAIALEALLHPSRCIDEIAVEIGESFLYVRPICSALKALGVLKYGGLVKSPTCGRKAHVVDISDDLADELYRHRADRCDDVDGVKIIIRRFIVARIMEAKIVGPRH